MGQGVTTALFKARRQGQQMFGIGVRQHPRHQWTANGEGAGFVKHDLVEVGGRLDRIAAAKQPAVLGGQTRSNRHHRRRRQAEGTGTGHHQHRDGQLNRQTDRG